MTEESELERELLEAGVSRGDFCFGEIRDGALSIIRANGKWLAITEERGHRVFEESFDDLAALRAFALNITSKKYYGGKKIIY